MKYCYVKYMLNNKGEYIYPENMSNIVWVSTIYDESDNSMIGETEMDVKADGKEIIKLKKEEFEKQKKKLFKKYKDKSSK